MHCPGDSRVQTRVGPQAAPKTSLPFPPPAVLPSYHLSSQKLGTGSGLSSGLSFPLEGEGSGKKGHFPHSAQAHPLWYRRELGGEDLGLGSVSASMELRELHASLLPGLQFSYSDANQVPTHPRPPPTPSFEVCHANPAPWSYQSRKSGQGSGGALEGLASLGASRELTPPPAPLLVSYLNTESHS